MDEPVWWSLDQWSSHVTGVMLPAEASPVPQAQTEQDKPELQQSMDEREMMSPSHLDSDEDVIKVGLQVSASSDILQL